MTLGEMIKRYRKENDLSMDAFAKRSGISKAYISLLEKNKHPKTGKPIAPSIQSIKQAADGMNMDFNSLFRELDGNVSLSEEKSLISRTLRPDESNLLDDYNVLSGIGKNKVTTYTKNLRDVEEAEAFVNAAHDRNDIDATEEMLQSDEDIMNDDNF